MFRSSNNANYQQLHFIESALLYDKHERRRELLALYFTLKQGFRKEIWKIKLKLKVLRLVSVIVPNTTFISYNIPLPCVVTMLSLIYTFEINIIKALMMLLVFGNQQNNSNQQFIYMNPTVMSATELTNDLKHKTE